MTPDLSPDGLTQLRQQAARLAEASPPDIERVHALVAALKRADEFGTARRLLARVRSSAALAPPLALRLTQEQALCTYHDLGLPAECRYAEALALLESIGLRDPDCRDKETLGQGGAIYRRMWECSGTLEHLYTALAFYRAGWERDPAHDLGWGGVNAAYVLDLLALGEQQAAARTGRRNGQAEAFRAQARALREDLHARLPALVEAAAVQHDYWTLATLAEIDFGLGGDRYASAGDTLARASASAPEPWMRQSTVEQLASLARLQGVPPPAGAAVEQWHPAWQALYRLAGADTLAAMGARRGKVGLALSGGGFRAALFHLGVLARLAECDILRHVETLSTVSGGSIVGAHYYLALRQLLRTRPDDQLTREDYIALVDTLIRDTVEGVARNLRVRALLNPIANLRMVFDPRYSRSMRIGELYERWLFSSVKDDQPTNRPRRLRDLIVTPFGTESFRPATDNWRRQAKVPNLMLNTTSLNSGHNWHFTVRWMGEPPGLTGDEVDMNARYRRVYYDQAPTPDLQNYPLAYAVAASSCVPAMFEPLPLEGLFADNTVRLVDGGVHDNQGAAACLNDECEILLCSDASGQMASMPKPANGMLGVFSRTEGILQDRVREAQYQALRDLADAGAVKGLFFIHMKQELDSPPIDFIGSDDPPVGDAASGPTSYGVDREIQRLLASVRTDLDSFTEVESCALMASGYLLTRQQLIELDREHKRSDPDGHWCDFDAVAPADVRAAGQPRWLFAPLLPLLALPPGDPDPRRRDLGVQLEASGIMFTRVWELVPALRWLRDALAAVLLVWGLWWLASHWNSQIDFGYQIGVGALTISAVIAVAALFWPAAKYLDPRSATKNVIIGLVAVVFGSLGSGIHLLLFEPLLRRRGRLARLLGLRPPG